MAVISGWKRVWSTGFLAAPLSTPEFSLEFGVGLTLDSTAQTVENLSAKETWVRSLHWEDPLEKGSTLGWRIPWTKEPGRLQSMGLQRVRHY